MQIIDLSQQIGDMSLGEIIVSLALVALVYAGILAYMMKLLNSDTVMSSYPTLDDAIKATDQQIITWIHTLPEAKTEEEFDTITYICERYVKLIGREPLK
jgi:hypothetical protein